MRTKLHSLLKVSQGLLATALVIAAAPAHATVDLADSPLFLTVAVPPNITLTLDDSGSMARAFVPDICGATSNDCNALDNRYGKSSHYNLLYYNPAVKYDLPKDADGNLFGEPNFEDAPRSGYYSSSSFDTRDLKREYRATAYVDVPPGATNPTEGYMGHYSSDVRCRSSRCEIRNSNGTWLARNNTTVPFASTTCSNDAGCVNAGMPAYYYRFDASNSQCNGTATDNDCFDIVFVTASSGPGTLDLNGDGVVNASDRDERQNFANWYSFARTRNLATQTATSLAFSDLDDDVRVAWQALHTCRNSATNFVDSDCDGWRNNFSNVSNRLRAFSGSHRDNFYSWITQLPTNDTTPLPAAMQRVGEYYRRGGDNNPYDSDLENTGSVVELSCRRNYHVMMTDGIWNNAISVTGGNVDDRTHSLPEPGASGAVTQYTARAPYRDAHSNTLADLAFYYWVNDLRSTLANDVLGSNRDTTGTDVANYWNPRNDPATWQHMVNFTIGLGLTGYLSQTGLSWNGSMYGGSYPSIAAGTTAWPEPGNDRAANVADLWHAAVNSRGQFFSADDPTSLAVAFRAALTAITDSSGSSAALSANSTSIQPNNTFVYQAKFDARDWSGTVLALGVGMDGRVNPNPVWDASQQVPAHGARRIFTHNGTTGVPFTSCSNLNLSQQAFLSTNAGGVVDGFCENRLQWLRGNSSGELRNGGTFRNRPRTVMGDVINSDPGYVKDIDYGYGSLPATVPGASSYAAYVSGNATRDAMVYVGANDGHMHALRASSGVEAFSFIPEGVFANLSTLTDPSYAHRHFVDGAITVGDAHLNGSWRSVLVAGLNAGGKSVYALDVTNPGSFSGSNVLWEFTELDMGYSFSQPQIGILQNGRWVAVFGNGYNSFNGGAYLYIVDLETGALLQKIRASDDPSDDESNGLSTPRLFDADGDRMIDAVYAGDLHGNLWKFDVSGNVGSWGVAYGGALFSAGSSQPITAQPKVGGHPNGGHVVVFGTGRYLGPSDVSDETGQSFYGIWDNGSRAGGRNALQRQDITTRVLHGRSVRTVSNYTPDWATERGWYVDLPAAGERSVSTPVIFQDRVIFVTIVPSSDPCSPGGTSWLMELKFHTGGTFNGAILDIDNDGSFSNDLIENADVGTTEVPIGVEMNLGISKTVTLIESPSDDPNITPLLFKIATGTSGGLETITNCPEEGGGCEPPTPTSPPGVTRRSWIQIR
jgi:type IV pilus assembly protein PilY1